MTKQKLGSQQQQNTIIPIVVSSFTFVSQIEQTSYL